MKKTAVILGGFFVFSVNIYGAHSACPDVGRVKTALTNSLDDFKSSFARKFQPPIQAANKIQVGKIVETDIYRLILDDKDKTKGCQYKVGSEVFLTIPMPPGR